MRLAGKVALITGAARGQGAAAARKYVAEGARVMIADVLDEPGKELAEELGEAARYRHLDVSSETDWASAIDELLEAFGRLDVLVNNAGILTLSAIAETSLAEYERIIRVNQFGTFLGIRSAVAPMTEAGGGSIVNISSIEGLKSAPGLIAYTASKFAIRGMTKAAAMELGEKGIRVNSVHPGVIDTAMPRQAAGDLELDLGFLSKKVPLRRVGTSDEIADLVLFLASDESSYCTGAEFVADGGATATHSLWFS